VGVHQEFSEWRNVRGLVVDDEHIAGAVDIDSPPASVASSLLTAIQRTSEWPCVCSNDVAGMDAYLSKPVQAATVVAMIDRWIPYREAQPA
jgi:CheY-like chemotaxis protein